MKNTRMRRRHQPAVPVRDVQHVELAHRSHAAVAKLAAQPAFNTDICEPGFRQVERVR